MASKSKRRRRVLGASCILAALIIGGSSFAWFTSKDEVVNRLSANAEYELAIAEQFQPPETWVPGQTIDKDVAVVNTGNVDAFARVWLTGSMRVLKQDKGNSTDSDAGWDATNKEFTTPATAVEDVNLLNMNLTHSNAGKTTYFKTLSTTQTLNPQASTSTNNQGYGVADQDIFSEVQAMQSGVLAYAPANAKYSYVLKEETELEIFMKEGSTYSYKTVKVPVGTVVVACDEIDGSLAANQSKAAEVISGTLTITAQETITSTSGKAAAATNAVYIKNTGATPLTALRNVEYESFTPMTDGLYLFLRTEGDSSATNPEFSGYWLNGYDETNKYENANFFALNTNKGGSNKSDYTVAGADTATNAKPITVVTSNGVITSVTPSQYLELYNAKYGTVNTPALKWFYDSTNKKIYAVSSSTLGSGSTVVEFDKDNDIVVEINLASANIGTDATQWTPLGAAAITEAQNQYKLADGTTTLGTDASKLTFYYNDDVESGDTTKILVDSVKMYDQVTNKAYLAFDFDLKVNMESVQVTFDENGNEIDTAVASGWAATGSPAVNTGATTVTQTPSPANGEITKMEWQ